MKKYFVLLFVLAVSLLAHGQAKKPTLMVVPSDNWCIQNGYTQTFDNQGSTEIVADYKKAFLQDANLNAVVAKINGLMADRGFPLKDMQTIMKSMNADAAEDANISSKEGNNVAESPLDVLRRKAKADIILELGWTQNQNGPKTSITYILRGLDSYSDKQIATAEGTGAPSFSAEVPSLLAEAVQDHMDAFCSSLQSYFEDMFDNGREITLQMKVFDNGSGLDFEKEYGDLELNEVIDNWLAENTVNHQFNKSDATESSLLYEQVRIPLYNESGQAIDAYAFARKLARYMKTEPYQIPVKTVNRGLGKCLVIFGEK